MSLSVRGYAPLSNTAAVNAARRMIAVKGIEDSLEEYLARRHLEEGAPVRELAHEVGVVTDTLRVWLAYLNGQRAQMSLMELSDEAAGLVTGAVLRFAG